MDSRFLLMGALVTVVFPLGFARLLADGLDLAVVCAGAGVVEAEDHSFMCE